MGPIAQHVPEDRGCAGDEKHGDELECFEARPAAIVLRGRRFRRRRPLLAWRRCDGLRRLHDIVAQVGPRVRRGRGGVHLQDGVGGHFVLSADLKPRYAEALEALATLGTGGAEPKSPGLLGFFKRS